jgi:hypothetical protein
MDEPTYSIAPVLPRRQLRMSSTRAEQCTIPSGAAWPVRMKRPSVPPDRTLEHFNVSDRPNAMKKQCAQLAVALVASTFIAACAVRAESSTPPAHPALECSGDGSGTGNYDIIGPGFETAAAALEDRLGYYQDLYGGEIIELPDNEAALQVAGSNVVVATASAAPSGDGFLVQEDYFCDDYRPQPFVPSATEPLVTSE